MPTPEQTGKSTPATAAPLSPEQLARVNDAVAFAAGGTNCVVCQNDDGRFVTTERHCLDLGGQVVEKFYGPCPVPPPPTATAAAGGIVVCSVGGKEFHTTAENCLAWNGTVVRQASGTTNPTG